MALWILFWCYFEKSEVLVSCKKSIFFANCGISIVSVHFGSLIVFVHFVKSSLFATHHIVNQHRHDGKWHALISIFRLCITTPQNDNTRHLWPCGPYRHKTIFSGATPIHRVPHFHARSLFFSPLEPLHTSTYLLLCIAVAGHPTTSHTTQYSKHLFLLPQ